MIGRDILGQTNVLFDTKGEVQVVAGGGKLSHPFFRKSDCLVATTAQAYFAMPLIVDETINRATSDKGIKVFKRSESFLELVQRYSLFWNLLVH